MEIKFNYFRKARIAKQWFIPVMALLMPLIFLASCKKDKTEKFNKAQLTVFQYISTNKQLSIYQAALKRAGLYNAETFSNGGPFTVFAPVDSAFISAGITLDSINKYDPQTLAQVLKYGIVNGRISSTSLVGLYSEDVTTLNMLYKPTITKNYYGIFFNGVPLVAGGSADLNDGVVQELQKTSFPPVGTILDVIKKAPDLTMLAAAIKALNLETKFSTIGVNSTYWTLLAPNDNAFKKFGYPDTASIYADPSKLSLVLQVSTLGGQQRLFTSSFLGGYAIGGKQFYVEPDGITIESIGNTGSTHIIRSNIMATNGVVQEVDQVLTPYLF